MWRLSHLMTTVMVTRGTWYMFTVSMMWRTTMLALVAVAHVTTTRCMRVIITCHSSARADLSCLTCVTTASVSSAMCTARFWLTADKRVVKLVGHKKVSNILFYCEIFDTFCLFVKPFSIFLVKMMV